MEVITALHDQLQQANNELLKAQKAVSEQREFIDKMKKEKLSIGSEVVSKVNSLEVFISRVHQRIGCFLSIRFLALKWSTSWNV